MPFDAVLIDRLRAELLDELIDDYVSVIGMAFNARAVLSSDSAPVARELVTETLVGLVNDPRAKVVDGPMRHTFTSADDLRRHLARTWPADGALPGDDLVVWLVGRRDPLGSEAPGR